MKVVIHLLLLTISVSALATPRLVLSKGNRLIFEGKVLAIGPSPGYGSGGVQAYQLVKYHINHLCEGDYDGAEIVVDHLLLDPDELKDLKIFKPRPRREKFLTAFSNRMLTDKAEIERVKRGARVGGVHSQRRRRSHAAREAARQALSLP